MLLVLNQYLYWKTDTDAVYLCVLVLFVFWLILRSRKIVRHIIKSRFAKFFISHMFIICSIVTILLQLYYNSHYLDSSMVYINRLLSTRPIMGRNVMMNYGPGLENTIKDIIFGMGDKATYLDSSYLALLTVYGLPVMLLFCFTMDYIAKSAFMKGDLFLAFCLLVFAVHCITDPQLSSFRANPFIIATMTYIGIRRMEYQPSCLETRLKLQSGIVK